jgi:hypothetical protein
MRFVSELVVSGWRSAGQTRLVRFLRSQTGLTTPSFGHFVCWADTLLCLIIKSGAGILSSTVYDAVIVVATEVFYSVSVSLFLRVISPLTGCNCAQGRRLRKIEDHLIDVRP